jgi:hypothetical protein
MRRLLVCGFLFFSLIEAQQKPPAQQDSVDQQKLRLLVQSKALAQCGLIVRYQNDAIKLASARIKDSQSVLYVERKAREKAIDALSNSIVSELQTLFPQSPMIKDFQKRKEFVTAAFDETYAEYSHAQTMQARQLAEAKKLEEERLKQLKIKLQIKAWRLYPMLLKPVKGKRASLLCCL